MAFGFLCRRTRGLLVHMFEHVRACVCVLYVQGAHQGCCSVSEPVLVRMLKLFVLVLTTYNDTAFLEINS